MTHVSVVLVKNINAVAGSYKKIPKRAKIIKIDIEAIRSIFLSLINKSNLFLCSLSELISFKSLINPLVRPILRNLFFLSLKISSVDFVLKYSKFLDIEVFTFCKIKFLSLWAPPIGS